MTKEMTPKEIFLEMLKPDGKPDRLLVQYEALQMCLPDPINIYLRGNRVRGSVSKDRWGTTILFPEDAPGPVPHHSPETTVLQDITRWKEVVKAPDIEANCSEGWEEVRKKYREKAGDERLLAGFMGTGIFEQCHFLMGFEDTLTNLYEHPDEMHELIEYITDYRIRYVKMLIEGLQPDVIFSHDDWGTKHQLFMKPEIWREFFKEPYRRFYGAIRDAGVIAIHHADSYLVPILDDMVEIGIQCWQGILPENNVPEVIQHLDGRMIVMGGIGAAIDREDADEEEIRQYVRESLEAYGPFGHYIPSITYGLAGTVYKHVDPFIDDEIRKYNEGVHVPRFVTPAIEKKHSIVRSSAVSTNNEAGFVEGKEQDALGKVATALWKGNRNRVLKACDAALEEGYSAKDILEKGLIVGMSKVGDDFTAGDLFVPEMLMSAKCMTAALEILKPKLVGGSEGGTVGKACIGTVKGDLHDIGKNLVKIMLEGNSIEVIDLGSDVSAETFVETAVNEKCDIICCSALLTTTMNEMKRVVELSKEAGIRDDVIIMLGGAPVSQDYCDRIGADIYTEDAAQAGRAAAEALAARA